ncbi:MAG TPA: TonB-dependent receptor [Candidatus Xenobia bacterium]|nr:TonB-dependent receptor [Candidatus Xenobia bacterium]
MKRLAFAALLVVSAIAGGAGLLSAQTISGVIAGTVRDPQGNPLATASVTVTNPSTGRTYLASTDANGYYRIPEVPPGVYVVEAELGGYQTERHKEVRVSVNRVTIEDFNLQIPPKTEVVEVTSAAPMSDTTSPTLTATFPEREVSELPILTRDVNNLGLLAAGVSSVRTFSFASTLVPFAVNGSRGRDNNFIIDSVDNNEPLFGGAATQFTNTDIFAEYTILTLQTKPEFGRNSGATVNSITKSGSNVNHGSLFWFTQADDFNARSRVEQAAFRTEPSQSYENQLGGTFGGALRKDKTFYFLSYQWDRAVVNLTNVFPVLGTLPEAAGLATLQGLSATPTLDAYLASPSVSGTPFLPANCFAAPAPAGFSTTNPCMVTGGTVGVDTNGDFVFDTFVPFNIWRMQNANLFTIIDHQFSVRLDHRLGRADDIYGRYLFDDLQTPRVPLSPAGDSAFADLGLYPEYLNISRSRTQSLLINERHYWVNALNEFRFSFSRVSQGIGPFKVPASVREGRAAATVEDIFVPGGFGMFAGQFPAAGLRFTLGRDTRPSQTDSDVFQVQDNFSWNRGRHSLKFGVNYVRILSDINIMPSDLGQYLYGLSFAGTTFAGGFDAFYNNEPLLAFQRLPNVITDSSGNIVGQGDPELSLREFDQFYFIQDDWRVRPNLTLSFGLRYENFGQPINRIRDLNPAGPRVDHDNNNFAPRLGFAWSPWKKTVVRGGYGFYYNPMVLNIPSLVWSSGPISPFVLTDTLGVGVAQNSGLFPDQPYTISDVNVMVSGCSNFFERGSIPPFATPPITTLINCSAQNTVEPDLVNPYIQQYSLGFQQELTSNLLFELNWVGTKGTKLYQRVDANPFTGWNLGPGGINLNNFCFPAFGRPFGICLNPHQDNTRGSITRVTNGGRSTYHGLQVGLTQRMARTPVGDFSFTGAYTWSHMIDNTSEIFGPGVRLLPQSFGDIIYEAESVEAIEAITPLAADPNNTLDGEKGDSSFDRRHRLALSMLWELWPDKGFWLGGWQISSIVTLQSGQPFSPLNSVPFGICRDYNGDGRLTNDRPAVGNPGAPRSSVALLADPECQDPTLGFVDLAGNAIDPMNARFVQVPLGLQPGDPFACGSGTCVAGSAGRNILTGPGLVNFDVAFYKNFRWGESKNIQFRWEVYNLFNHPNPGNAIGNVFATDAQPTPAFAFAPRATAASVTGVQPENALDAIDLFGNPTFLSESSMNTSSRRMQFGIKFIF